MPELLACLCTLNIDAVRKYFHCSSQDVPLEALGWLVESDSPQLFDTCTRF